ncbi:MAG: TRAP transporter small permease [Gammaproteobacteria bacterium]|nr:TRAP transporter small permease [Gammaproteobacteria bacterium]
MNQQTESRGFFAWLERHFEESIAGVCLTIMSLLVFYQVVMRYAFHRPTSWSDEIAVYAMLWGVYLSASWCVRERTHIRVMNFIQMFPKKMQTGLTVTSDLIWFAFAILMTWQGILLDLSLWESRFESPALKIDQKWPYLCIAVGFGMMTLRLIQVYYLWIWHGVPLMPETDGHGDAETEGLIDE